MSDYIFLGFLFVWNIVLFVFSLLQIPVLDFTEYVKYGLVGIIVVQNIIIFVLGYFLYKTKKNDPNVRLMEKMMDLIGGRKNDN